MSEMGKECARTSREAFQPATDVADQIIGDGVSEPSQQVKPIKFTTFYRDVKIRTKVPLTKDPIPATTDKRLKDYGTTEFSCNCPGLTFKTDIHLCPFNGDRICRHIHRVRVKQRLEELKELFLRASVSIGQLYGPTVYADFISSPSSEMIALESELAREPDPQKKKKPQAKVLTFWEELQNLKIC